MVIFNKIYITSSIWCQYPNLNSSMIEKTKDNIFSIVVTYNGSKTICDCLESVKKSESYSQIIVIDNASTDETRSLVQNFLDIIFIPLDKNIGFGQANNIGIEYALNNDAEFVFYQFTNCIRMQRWSLIQLVNW